MISPSNDGGSQVSMTVAQEHQGLFLAIEGIDGAGKTTQAHLLIDRLAREGFNALYAKEPTNGPWGMKIKEIALNGRAGITPETELDYFIRDREEDVRLNILPALSQGWIVIADRYFYSTIAYQSVLGIDPFRIRELNAPFPVPRLVFMLEIDPALSRVRITKGRREEANQGYEQTEYLTRVRAAFDVMDDPNIVRLDGTAARETVAANIWKRVSGILPSAQN